jgi:hypothetical protein
MRTLIMADRNTTIDRTTLNGSGRLSWLDCPRRQQRIGPNLGVEVGAEA